MILDPRSAAIFAILAAMILALSAIVASAQNAPTYRSKPTGYWDDDDNWRSYHRPRRHHRHREYTLERRREVRGWHSQARGYYPNHDHDEGRCKGFLAAVGDQYASEAGAQEESNKAWMQTARWQHGERYMSRDNAADASYECGRSSVGSVVGQVFYRCRLKARPCRPTETGGSK